LKEADENDILSDDSAIFGENKDEMLEDKELMEMIRIEKKS